MWPIIVLVCFLLAALCWVMEERSRRKAAEKRVAEATEEALRWKKIHNEGQEARAKRKVY